MRKRDKSSPRKNKIRGRSRSTIIRPSGQPSPDNSTTNNLDRIDHIVVLMLENRSFDHMLGYLTIAGRNDIDGLKSTMSNQHNSKTYVVSHLNSTAWGDYEDPCHSGQCVVDQLSNGNGGFVRNYAAKEKKYPEVIMGYYERKDVPVFDYLAREFCVCDRWFSSVAGATWPNRLYAVTGKAAGSKDNQGIPWYSLPSFVRHLDQNKASWHWYCHDAPTLRLIDNQYRFSHHDHFYWFRKKSPLREDFLDHARDGLLPNVSWIDPNFVNFGIRRSRANDDHPPADVKDGQFLVSTIYNALITSPLWNRIMFIITYDEHGGFYDHVSPGTATDNDPNFRSYGVRVPSLVISPLVKKLYVSSTVFDHTSIIKTILNRFCKAADGSIPNMGARVASANDLGPVLTLTQPRQAPPLPVATARNLANHQKEIILNESIALSKAPAPPPKLTDFQKEILLAEEKLRKRLPPGQP